MFTATENIILPATVTGSWPRPRWYQESLRGRAFSTGMTDMVFREQYLDAVAALVSNQERAGLDIVVNGDYHLDDDLGGQSWIRYPLERLSGVDTDRGVASVAEWKFPTGTLLNDIMNGWRFPPITDKIGVRLPYEFDMIWRSTQATTDRPVKFGTISAQTAAAFAAVENGIYGDDKRELIWEFSGLMNQQLRRLVEGGCKVIQIEDPLIHFAATSSPPAEELEFYTAALNREIEGLDGAEVWVHTCWGNPNMQRVPSDASYENSIEYYLYKVNCDVLTVEMSDDHYREIDLLGRYKDVKKKVAVGAISHRQLQVEESADIAENIRMCLKHVPAERLALSSDCGFGRQGFDRTISYYKSASLVRAANIVRAELGVPVTTARNDDPATQLQLSDVG